MLSDQREADVGDEAHDGGMGTRTSFMTPAAAAMAAQVAAECGLLDYDLSMLNDIQMAPLERMLSSRRSNSTPGMAQSMRSNSIRSQTSAQVHSGTLPTMLSSGQPSGLQVSPSSRYRPGRGGPPAPGEDRSSAATDASGLSGMLSLIADQPLEVVDEGYVLGTGPSTTLPALPADTVRAGHRPGRNSSKVDAAAAAAAAGAVPTTGVSAAAVPGLQGAAGPQPGGPSGSQASGSSSPRQPVAKVPSGSLKMSLDSYQAGPGSPSRLIHVSRAAAAQEPGAVSPAAGEVPPPAEPAPPSPVAEPAAAGAAAEAAGHTGSHRNTSVDSITSHGNGAESIAAMSHTIMLPHPPTHEMRKSE